jgi:hypothetical protein
MQKRTLGLCITGAVVFGFVWYWFRPELLFLDRVVNEGLPGTSENRSSGDSMAAANSIVLARGVFHSVAHETTGVAAVYRLDDGKLVLRLTDFATSNGPDVHVYLIAATDATDNPAVTEAGFIELGPIKGNKGNQNYALPDVVDLDRYRAVTIWCKRFSVNFGTAPLLQSMRG